MIRKFIRIISIKLIVSFSQKPVNIYKPLNVSFNPLIQIPEKSSNLLPNPCHIINTIDLKICKYILI